MGYIFTFKKRKSSRGAAAMLVTTAMALLFVVLVVGLSWLSIREQRLAGDTDQSNRAIGFADAGIKDALARLKASASYREDNCTPYVNLNIVCRTITDEPGPIRIYAKKDQPRKANIFEANYDNNATPGATGVHYATSFEIFWCKVGSANNACETLSSFPGYFPTMASFGNNKPPILELEFAYWQPDSTDVDARVNFPQTTDYASVKACPSGTCSIDDPAYMQSKTFVLYPGLNQEDVSPLRDKLIVTCGSQIVIKYGYLCKTNNARLATTVYGSSEADTYKYRTIFSVTPRYGDSFIEARFYNENIASASFPAGTKIQGNLVPVPAMSIIIDVTSKSGNTYRRLTSYLARPTQARAGSNPAIYSGTDICKNMRVDDGFNVTDANGASEPCSENAPGVVY